MTKRTLPLLTLLMLCLGATAFAQDPLNPNPRKDGRRKGKLEFELPSAPEKARPTAPSTPAELVSALLEDLGAYPAGASARAIDQLVLSGPAVKEPLRLVLDGIHFPPRMAAAVALSRLGDALALDGMERLFLDPRGKKWAGQVLGLIFAVDQERAELLAALHAGKSDTALRLASFRFLGQHLRPELSRALRPLLKSDRAPIRRQAFALLSSLKDLDLGADCLELLGDEDASLAAAVSQFLADQNAEATVTRLVDWSRQDPPDRHSLWALLTVAELEDQHSVLLLNSDQIPVLSERLTSLDPMVRVASAVALAQIGFRSDADGIETLLAEQVLPTLMETFLQNSYFKDYKALFSLASVRIKRITGVELGDDLTKWRAAWKGEGATPLIRRDLPPERLPELAGELVVRLESKGFIREGSDNEIVLAGDRLLAGPESSRKSLSGAVFVDQASLRELAEALLASGVLERGRRRIDGADDGAVYRRLRLIWQNRERSVVLGAEPDAAFDLAQAAIRRQSDAAQWQRMYVGDPRNFPEFYRQQAAHFGPEAGEQERKQRLLRAVQIGLPALGAHGRMEALLALWRTGLDRELVGPEEFRLLLHGLRDEQLPEGTGSVLARILTDVGDPVLFSPFAEFVVDQYGESGEPLLKRVIRGLDLVDSARLDPRPLVRIAALREGSEGGGLSAEALLEGLSDPEARVRRAAIMGLGHCREAVCKEKLYEMAQGEHEAIRGIALEALGWDRSKETQDLLASAVEVGEPSDVLAAYRALARIGNSTSIDLLAQSAVRFGMRTQTGLSALDMLASIGTKEAQQRLIQLLESEDQEVREEAAYRLATCGEMRAVPELLAVLDTPDRAARSRDALALLLGCDGGEGGEIFVQRFRDEPSLSQAEWFRRAIDVGLVSTDSELLRGVPLPLLLRALRDQRWFVRHQSIASLEQEFGVHFGTPYRFETRADAARIAERWERHFAVPIEVR